MSLLNLEFKPSGKYTKVAKTPDGMVAALYYNDRCPEPWAWTVEGEPLAEYYRRFVRQGVGLTEADAVRSVEACIAARRIVTRAFAENPLSPRFHPVWDSAGGYADDIVCPYCGNSTEGGSTESHEMFPQDFDYCDGDNAEVFCPDCDKKFSVTVHVTYNYTPDPIEEDPKVAG